MQGFRVRKSSFMTLRRITVSKQKRFEGKQGNTACPTVRSMLTCCCKRKRIRTEAWSRSGKPQRMATKVMIIGDAIHSCITNDKKGLAISLLNIGAAIGFGYRLSILCHHYLKPGLIQRMND